MKWYLKVLRNYVNFDGRARRKEFWMFVLFHWIFIMLALCIGYGIGIGGGLFDIYLLITLLPNVAVRLRRLHDIGKSGGFIFITLIPLVGWIWILVLYCTEGTRGENEYGPDPKTEIL